MLFKEIIQHASDKFRKWYKRNCIHERCNKEIRNKDSEQVYLWFLKNSFLLFTFCNAITNEGVHYAYTPVTFATWEVQRINFAFDEEKVKYVYEKRFTLGDSFNFTFFFEGIFYQMYLTTNVFLCGFIYKIFDKNQQ